MISSEIREIQKRLLNLQDPAYREFQCKLMPTVNPDSVIGIRTPALRAFAREMAKNKPLCEKFLASDALPHFYYEENNLHAFLIEQTKDFSQALELLDIFLPYVDNWATCDSMKPKVLAKPQYKDLLLQKIKLWIADGNTYTVRFGIGLLMNLFLGGTFQPEYAGMVASVRSEEYYVNMMIAWYFATALAKNYDEVIPYLQNRLLSGWVHNKTIRKAIESYRITDEQKIYLRTLCVKDAPAARIK